MNRIGEIEILKARIYNLDAECHCPTQSTVVVQPGRYPLFSDGLTTYWVMSGKLNMRGPWRMGDGMFAMHDGDVLSDIEVTFPSKRFGSDEWTALLAGTEFQEGEPTQRLRAHLSEAVAAE